MVIVWMVIAILTWVLFGLCYWLIALPAWAAATTALTFFAISLLTVLARN